MFRKNYIYSRQIDIHTQFGGQIQGGISTPSDKPYIFLFTGESGADFGYKDGWAHGIFEYTGEGQVGDMKFIHGNKAIKDHMGLGKELYCFKKKKPAW